MKKMKIIHISSEVAPFSKTGGLGDVSRSLPKALHRLGHQVSVITPLYGKIIDKKKHKLEMINENIRVVLDSENSVQVNFWRGELNPGLAVYFIENKEHFSRYKKIYVSHKDNIRFLVFNMAALRLISLLDEEPDIIHCHDWHTGLIPYYIKHCYRYTRNLSKTKTIYTIHNLVFQMGRAWYSIPNEEKDYGRKKLPLLSDPSIININFAKRAIMSADIVNTVSERYRDEIMTKKFGQDLHRVLKNREDRLFGIINGIDYYSYNPQKDKTIYKKYGLDTCQFKKDNKKYLQKKFKFNIDEDIPVICSTSRIVHQKGFDITLALLPHLLKLDVQVIFMGDGDSEYIKRIKRIQKKYPKKILWLPFKEELETQLYAASDFFILPSYYEPCGINQMIAMRYGAIPVVREVGGLYDTVSNFNPNTNKGTGFTFKSEDEFSFFWALTRALENYKYKKTWTTLVSRAMRQSSSWEIPARKYLKLYQRALRLKK